MKIIRRDVRGYYGMNHQAATELHLSKKSTPPDGTIFVDKDLKGRMLKRTIAHEKEESFLMKHKGMDYKSAHKVAMQWEKNVR